MKFKNIFNKMAKNEEKDPQATIEENTKDTLDTLSQDNVQDNDKQSHSEEEGNTVASEAAQLKADLAAAKDKHIRLLAEFDNYRKRTNREKLEMRQLAAKDTLTALLPVLDDFDRAKRNHDDVNSTEEFSEGVMFVYDKILTFMKGQNLRAIRPTGEAFDVDFHEAITEIPAPNEDMKGKIIDTIEPGYILNDKIIRHAKVVVGK